MARLVTEDSHKSRVKDPRGNRVADNLEAVAGYRAKDLRRGNLEAGNVKVVAGHREKDPHGSGNRAVEHRVKDPHVSRVAACQKV
jgi:hypothetical protein